jgi:phosphoglycolate phosphatase
MTILNNTVNTIIFDLDGPLLEGKHRHYRCYADILKEKGFAPVTIEHYWSMKRDRVDRYEQLKKSNAENIYDLYLELWIERIETRHYLQLDCLQPSVIEILSMLQQTGIRLLLATLRNNESNLLWQLNRLKLTNFFSDIIVVGSLNGNNNKADEVSKFLHNQDCNDVLWIGDTEVDIYSARQLNIKIAALSCGLRTETYLSTLQPNFLCDNLVDLLNHQHIIL